MYMRPVTNVLGLAIAGAVLAACGGEADGGGPRRSVPVVVHEAGCEPTRIDVTAGERLAFEVRNDAKGDREFEGIEGTKIEETEVPAGKSRTIHYTVPQTDKPLKVKCYSAGGPTTVIELVPRVPDAGGTPRPASGDAGY